MKYNTKKIISIFFIFLLFLILLAIPFRHRIKNRIVFYYGKLKSKINGSGMATCQDCDTLFKDNIQVQEKAYRKEGIAEQETDEGLLKLEQKGILKNIESNDFYIVQNFHNSQPLLLPKAILFLDNLSNLYKQKCTDSNNNYVPFEITSATRSKNSIEDLKKENANAIKNSAHLRGKTFDISYGAFTENKIQLKLFVKTLSELKNQNKCFIKYERNGCLHITVN